MGGVAGGGSGDIFLAFSTVPAESSDSRILTQRSSTGATSTRYEATVQATEESIINAMLAAKTITGGDCYKVNSSAARSGKIDLTRYGRTPR